MMGIMKSVFFFGKISKRYRESRNYSSDTIVSECCWMFMIAGPETSDSRFITRNMLYLLPLLLSDVPVQNYTTEPEILLSFLIYIHHGRWCRWKEKWLT